ncbi:hypothetical protein ABTY96_03325 [Streptomyces sp. NPDC096057]|uniref:hypothetical protein n=1 Tax=Streptomyces sp. NPDC096057 TaxID=3155543 RepID=UPI00331FC534
MSKYGDGIEEPYAFGGFVTLSVREFSETDSWLKSDLRPDEARLLGLRLIKMADEAEAQG